MALSSCFLRFPSLVSLWIDHPTRSPSSNLCSNGMSQRCRFSLKSTGTGLFGQAVVGKDMKQLLSWDFLGGSRIMTRPNLGRTSVSRKSSVVSASWLAGSEIAAGAFTWGTIAVLPCYAFMVVAPQAKFTKKVVGSSIPYIGLGILYAYLLYLSWTPDTIRFMFASKYLLPELPGIAKMFSSEMTLASAWIHLLAVDLFAARQVYFDGLQDNVETRHSVSLCLLFCPIGILTHFITKAVTSSNQKTEHGVR